MTTRLSQVVAVEKTRKTEAYGALTAAHHQVQKPPLLAGITRTYRPRDEEGEILPAESTRVQFRADDAIDQALTGLRPFYDVTATKDWANCEARADIRIGDQVLLAAVPVTYLLFLEKQLTSLHTFVDKLPVLDPSEQWQWDEQAGVWRTAAYETVRSKKVPRNHVKAPATDKHPAQVEVYYEDVPVGTWTTVKFSGALPATRRQELLNRLAVVRDAIKYAREEANATVVTNQRPGATLLNYLFAA
ncbi:hypothetical protein [Actinacidiphila sp. ITFR-21]|uniref:DUF7873 family protein n=1 Tax=Actinacidiphila sp. ITFR-21 TaxID=3075199 RepID=UPI00288938D2|nr:hypothetical protein [Streptomyces sp. ITFR-21]WNI17661.1 hypothetical protein RLT57_20440 [Streptomyces sp. ITFR-21]WNI17801.1 hypothetical protein RLT57_21155 [Streptomyces sp. ITFR-21]